MNHRSPRTEVMKIEVTNVLMKTVQAYAAETLSSISQLEHRKYSCAHPDRNPIFTA